MENNEMLNEMTEEAVENVATEIAENPEVKKNFMADHPIVSLVGTAVLTGAAVVAGGKIVDGAVKGVKKLWNFGRKKIAEAKARKGAEVTVEAEDVTVEKDT